MEREVGGGYFVNLLDRQHGSSAMLALDINFHNQSQQVLNENDGEDEYPDHKVDSHVKGLAAEIDDFLVVWQQKWVSSFKVSEVIYKCPP